MQLPKASALLIALISAAAAHAADPSMARQMADSILARQPVATQIENKDGGSAKWSYSTAFCVRAVTQVGVALGAEGDGKKYFQYGKTYMDTFIDADGKINATYPPAEYRLDDIAPGQLVLILFNQTKDERYHKAALQLCGQLKTQPRVEEGGFWHKKGYPEQMWLDGIFMDCPFMARTTALFGTPNYYDEVAHQITLLARHAQDPKTGLCYHAWDAGKSQKWADPQTGLSKNFWGRAMGWYLAGIVETLDYLPENHPRRAEVIAVLAKACDGLEKVQDARSGLWYQVLDMGGREGNYTESSASSMFVYVMHKAARKGWIDARFKDVARRGYAGLLKEKIVTDPQSGLLTLKDTCLVAGLGQVPGSKGPYRDGSYEYYLSEKRVENDPKGMAPFILASLELEGK